LERWDTFFYRSDFVDLESQLSGIQSLPLGELLNFISRPWKKEDFPNRTFEYIEISSVTKQQGIISSRTVDAKNAPSRATTLIKTGDIILATTRPYLGAFAIVPDKYDGCVCSSGFALADGLKSDGADKNFIMFFLKSTAGLKQMERRMTGGLYPAIVQNELEKVKIPLPPINIQREIVQKIEEGNVVIKRERDAAVRLDTKIKKDIEALILGTKTLEGFTNYA
jgi:restriction endonuclease S subunit